MAVDVSLRPSPAPAADAPPAPASGRADVGDLLHAYRAALDLAAELPPSRLLWPRFLTRPLARLRVTFMTQRFLVEHIRRTVDTLQRRYCVRLALGQDDGNDAEDREALERFASSLPRALSSHLRVIVPVLIVLGVAQVMIGLGDAASPEDATFQRVAQVVDLNPTHFQQAVSAILASRLVVVLDVMAIFVMAAYVVFRPLVPGIELARQVVNRPSANRRRRGRSPLGVRAREIDVHGEEVALFRALGMRAPTETIADLLVKAIVVLFWLIFASWSLFAEPQDGGTATGLVAVGLCAARAGWLWRELRRRNLGHYALVLSHSSRSD